MNNPLPGNCVLEISIPRDRVRSMLCKAHRRRFASSEVLQGAIDTNEKSPLVYDLIFYPLAVTVSKLSDAMLKKFIKI